ncbi:ABC transporter permease [Enterococcus crotali]|uniref:ABC transporter permease n=1 Tax=Enterococcus crotali TaxID=1453587 RepID=UPI000AFD1C3B|nr:ABC transporter permease [Enterococcus crotali]
MFAANHFFLLKRGKEIGLYHLIGMRKEQIAFLFFVETLILGAISLVTGIILGIIFSKLFSMILAKAMFLQVESLFSISFPSMIQTSVTFVFMLLAVSLRSIWLIYRYQVSNMLGVNKKRAGDPNKISVLKIFLGVLGVGLIGTGYFLSYNIIHFGTSLVKTGMGYASFLLLPVVIMFICMLGTYLFFKYTMYLVVYLFGKNKYNYYRNLNMLASGNTIRHIKRSSTTLSSVTIFIAIALGMIGGAASFYTIGMNSVNITTPTDFIVAEDDYEKLTQRIEQEPDTKIDSPVKLNYKLTGSRFHLKIGQDDKQNTISPINLLSLSNYQEYQKINPYLKNIRLNNDQDVVILDSIKNILGGFIRYGSEFVLTEDVKLHVSEIRQDYLGQDLLRYSFPTLVVSDQQFNEINSGIIYTLTAFNVNAKDEDALANKLSEEVKPNWITPVYTKYKWVDDHLEGYTSRTSLQPKKEQSTEFSEEDEQEAWQLNYASRFSDLRYERRVMGLFIYVAMFLGVLALIITGSILMLQQFSEAEREKENYDLLKKIGVPKKKITQLIYQQNSIIFFPPMIIGVLHATFAIYVFSRLISSSGYWLAYLSCGMLILIYLAYYFLTSAIYSRIIHGHDR